MKNKKNKGTKKIGLVIPALERLRRISDESSRPPVSTELSEVIIYILSIQLISGWRNSWERSGLQLVIQLMLWTIADFILGMGSAKERRRYIATSSLIGWTHTLTIDVRIFTDHRLWLWQNPHYSDVAKASRGFKPTPLYYQQLVQVNNKKTHQNSALLVLCGENPSETPSQRINKSKHVSTPWLPPSSYIDLLLLYQ